MNFIFIFQIFLLLSCKQDDFNGINFPIDSLPYPVRTSCEKLNNNELPKLIWKTVFIDDALAASMNPIIQGNHVIVSRSADFHPPDEIIGYNLNNGIKQWEWSDYITQGELIFDGPHYIDDDIMFICTWGSLYLINVSIGQTIFNKKYGNHEKCGSYGENNLVTFTYSASSSKEAAVFNKGTSEVISLASYPKSSEYKGSFSTPFIYQKSFYFSFNSYHFQTKSNNSVLFKVDLVNNSAEFRWKKEIPGKGTIGNFGYQIQGNRLYVIERDLYCINTDDGSILWKQPNIYGGPAGLIIADNKLIVGSNHLNPSLFAFNLLTGEIIWKEPFSGTASPLQYHSCVIYSVGGGDGLLHAVDVNTGTHLYKMTSPDYADNSNLFFDNCAVDTSTNSIILTNFKYVMRYQLPEY